MGRFLEMIILSEISQIVKDKHHMISLICGILQMNLSAAQKQTHKLWKQIYGYQKGQVVGGGLGVWDWHMHSEVSGMIGQQGPTV